MNYTQLKIIPFILALLFTTITACGSASFRGAGGDDPKVAKLQNGNHAARPKDGKSGDLTDSKLGSKANGDGTDSGTSQGKEPTDGSTSEGGGGNPSDGGEGEGDDLDLDEGKLITNIVELEECKAEIFERTGDLSLCMKCFADFMAAGGVISKVKCGCETKEVSRTTERL